MALANVPAGHGFSSSSFSFSSSPYIPLPNQVWENQRWYPVVGFSHKQLDRPAFSNRDGTGVCVCAHAGGGMPTQRNRELPTRRSLFHSFLLSFLLSLSFALSTGARDMNTLQVRRDLEQRVMYIYYNKESKILIQTNHRNTPDGPSMLLMRPSFVLVLFLFLFLFLLQPQPGWMWSSEWAIYFSQDYDAEG